MTEQIYFVPRVDQAVIDKAREDYPFLKTSRIEVVDSEDHARLIAFEQVCRSLPKNSFISSVTKAIESEAGWTVHLNILKQH